MADQEHLNLLTQGVEVWNQWKGDTHEISPSVRWNLSYDADLSGTDLSGADLSKVNLENVDLTGANFAGAHLVGACFAEAELTGANFAGAHLVGACFAEAELAEANFVGASLIGAELSGANVCAADFSNADLRNADLSGADLSEACFQGANLSMANLSGADLSKARLLDANLSEANFSGVYSGSYLLEAYLHRADIRRAKEAGAVMRQAHTEHQGAERLTTFSFKRNAQGQNIVLSVRTNGRLVRLIGLSLLFVIGGVGILHSPGNLMQAIMGTITVLFFGLGGIILLLQFLLQLFRRIPLLVMNDEGIQYFYPFRLETVEHNPMTHRNITFKWREIGAIGFITKERTNSFAVYASAKRWRSGWSPSIQIPQSLLPISARQLIALIQDRYQMQIEAHRIEGVEVTDTPSLPRKRKR